MPHNFKQLEKLKGLLKAHVQSPSSTKAALDQLIKGCEMAFNGGALLTQENQYLRITIEELQQKRKRSHRQIIRPEGFSVQEARDFIQHGNEAQEAQSVI